ncbi:MAG: M24 family metallopeptidase [Promethearchaeota archaeon]
MKQQKPIGFQQKRCKKIMEDLDLDLLIASTPENVFYTSGLPTTVNAPNPILYVLKNQYPYFVLINREGEEFLIHWDMYRSANFFSWIPDCKGITSPKEALRAIFRQIKAWGVREGKIGLESLLPRYAADFIYGKCLDATIDAKSGDKAFAEMRLIKTEEEVKRIKKSTEVAEKAIMACIDASKEGITDSKLLQIARKTMVNASQDVWGWDHLTMNVGHSDPEAPGQGIKMKMGDLSRFDFGAVYKGYVSDVSRQMVLGEVPNGVGEAYDRMLKMQNFALDNIKAGVIANDLNKESAEYYKTMAPKGMHFVIAHTIGLETEEMHMFGPNQSQNRPFEENMVLDVEVWEHVENWGLVGVEDCYRVTKAGVERLSSLDREIFIR